jgi:alcohol dehydrogenase (NADP+)
LSHILKKQDEALKLGADGFCATSDPTTLKKLSGYFDLMINTVSVELNSNKYLRLLTLDETMVIVGLPENEMQVGTFSLTNAHRRIGGSVIGGT